ncbi:MAG: DUF3299 domain-containing protein [Pseudomonadales bacterium]|nr:DUF3299 domain-containing protein [Pseudomonadales bacterium]MBO6594666.1 DUF3299 domain-containing protein [Pseudomonadales bacterium]MBO6821775.1 DUF3299 domain-containing protein [Pseudomonadales bacterium]
MKQTLPIVITIVVLMTSSIVFSQPDDLDIPVSANNQDTYRFEILSDSGYTDERGRSIIDVIEGYQVNLALSVDNEEGRPVIGLQPDFNLEGTSAVIPPGQSTALSSTDESGIVEFSVTAGLQGMDKLTVSFGENEATVYFNVISLAINDFPTAQTLESGLNWSELMQTKLDFVDGNVEITFPEIVKQQNGEVVRVSGFMMPLDPDSIQRHFLLTSSPPHCFFHIPGGPAGVIEVFSEEGVEASWAPVILEGEFELIDAATTGVIYQMKQARVVDPKDAL